MNSLKCLFIVAALLSASLVLAQQPGSQTTTPPQSTRPTLPPDTAAPPPSRIPDQEKPSGARPDEAQSQIVQKLQTEPGLSSRDIIVEVTKDTVVLSGSVPTQNDRAVAQRIVQSYAGAKRIENRLVIATEDDMNKAKKRL